MCDKYVVRKRPYRTSTSFYRNVKKYKNIPKIRKSALKVIRVSSEPKLSENCDFHENEQINDHNLDIFDVPQQVEDVADFHEGNLPNFDLNGDDVQETDEKISLMDQIRTWSLNNKITHTALNGLLEILRTNAFNYLPKDSRTLLQTPEYTEIKDMLNGQYWHYGVQNCLVKLLSQVQVMVLTSISLIFNVDGLPIAGSSKNQFWPIFCAVDELPSLPVAVIGVYCGETKPPLKDFLNPFVGEMLPIIKDGLTFRGLKITVKIKYFTCDSPARAFVKGVVNFNSYYGCMKCTTVGEFDHNRMSFPRINCPPRTDEGFRCRKEEDHHKEKSPLEDLPLDMVKDFIVADSLHLLHLGVMKKLLQIWTTGMYSFDSKWSAYDIKRISELLVESNTSIPREIHRAVRPLDHLLFWEGVEFRTFLMYLGPVMLKDFLQEDVYNHFLVLFCAVTICSSQTYSEYLDVAETMFDDYIEGFIQIYGSYTISSNIHNLSHSVDDVKRFGILSNISSYKFENYLGYIKSLLRHGNKPLAQCARRLLELSKIQPPSDSNVIYPLIKNKINDQSSVSSSNSETSYSTLMMDHNLVFTTGKKNKWFMTKNNEIVCIKAVRLVDEKINIFGSSTKMKNLFFEKPIKSSYLNIYMSKEEFNHPQMYSLSNIKCKLTAVKYHNNTVFLPLIHTLDFFKNMN